MSRRSTPGLGQWLTVTFIVIVAMVLLYQLFQYGSFRSALPAGLTVGGVDVGGRSLGHAQEILTDRYLNAPVLVYHGENAIEILPTDHAEFKLDLETMSSEADYQRSQQDFWAGFWGYLWDRPIEVEPIELRATHNTEVLEKALQVISDNLDTPSQPPQAVPSTLSFKYGQAGLQTNISASMENVSAALYRPTGREAHLVVERLEPKRPDIGLLARLIVNHLQDFELNFGGTVSIFIMDLRSGDEISINEDLPISLMNMAKIPIVLETYRVLDRPPTAEQRQLIHDALTDMGTTSANLLLSLISGADDPDLGAESVTQTMQKLGLRNTFIAVPFEGTVRRTYDTPANQMTEVFTNPDPGMQTTAEDMGALLAMIYYCAQNNGGALMAAFPDQITAAECQEMIEIMQSNFIGSLLQEGVPSDTPVAHQQGWISDTHGDAGIAFSPGGDYIVVEYLYKPDWLEWELSSPLLADISRAAYNFFNFETPYLEGTRTN